MFNKIDIEHACTALIMGFSYKIDSGDYTGVIELFAEDGIFERPGVYARGHPELRAMLDARPTDVITRHICATPLFIKVAEHATSSVTYFTLYQNPRGEGPFPTFKAPAAIAEYRDTFIRMAHGWRIATRKVVVGMIYKF